MQTDKVRKINASIRYIVMLTRKLLVDDKYILPMYLMAIMAALNVVLFSALYETLDIVHNKAVLTIIIFAIVIYFAFDINEIKLIAKCLINMISNKPAALADLERSKFYYHIRKIVTNSNDAKYSIGSLVVPVYVILLIIGRIESWLLQSMKKNSGMTISNNRMLRR